MHSFKSKWDVLHYYSILHARCKKYAACGADKKPGVVGLTKSMYVVPYPSPASLLLCQSRSLLALCMKDLCAKALGVWQSVWFAGEVNSLQKL